MLQWRESYTVPGNVDGTVLQWGHDLAVMESAFADGDQVVITELQWGHDLAVMERATPGATGYS